ncbi:hypothetical protein QU24_13450 [Pantoea rodasii]|uniref:Uncharacterized protein n=2 Tax=Pantoea TaxID=53335 RepID=A0A0U3TFG3_9GAMM|nr:hypothetical protein LK04_02835 [Pantoea vagans]KHJ67590.1 hypothetical protein QU24_13450 [Pantoea rodasii]
MGSANEFEAVLFFSLAYAHDIENKLSIVDGISFLNSNRLVSFIKTSPFYELKFSDLYLLYTLIDFMKVYCLINIFI